MNQTLSSYQSLIQSEILLIDNRNLAPEKSPDAYESSIIKVINFILTKLHKKYKDVDEKNIDPPNEILNCIYLSPVAHESPQWKNNSKIKGNMSRIRPGTYLINKKTKTVQPIRFGSPIEAKL